MDHFSFSFCVLEVKELHLLEEDKREDRVGTEAGVGGSPALEEGDWTLGPEDLEETVQGAPVLTGLVIHHAGLDHVKGRADSGGHEAGQETGGEVGSEVVLKVPGGQEDLLELIVGGQLRSCHEHGPVDIGTPAFPEGQHPLIADDPGQTI